MTQEQLARYHRRTRRREPNKFLYLAFRLLLRPLIFRWLRVETYGPDHSHRDGAHIIISNHRSTIDPWAIASQSPRHTFNFMAKAEHFKNPLFARFLNALGAFPVLRGQHDAEAISTCHAVLKRGGVLVIFPEGTRSREARPKQTIHRGAAQLAIEYQCPVLLGALEGTQNIVREKLLRRTLVRGHISDQIWLAEDGEDAQALSDRLWSEVLRLWETIAPLDQPARAEGNAAFIQPRQRRFN